LSEHCHNLRMSQWQRPCHFNEIRPDRDGYNRADTFN
jgi:hypothetical protein